MDSSTHQRLPSPDEMERARQFKGEASICFDRAVALAPKEVEVYLQRAFHKCAEAQFDRLLGDYRDKTKLDGEAHAALTAAFFSKPAVPDLQKAVTLQPRTYQLIGLAAWIEWASIAMGPLTIAPGQPIKFTDFPESARRSIVNAMKRLSELGNSGNSKLAAGALVNLAALRMFTGSDTELITPDMRRAVSLDPAREAAWDLLLGSILETAPPNEFAQVCEDRLKNKESARNHLIVAKAWYRCGKFEKTAMEAKATIRLETDNLPARLMLGAALLRQNKGEAGEEELDSIFTETGELIKKSANAPQGRDWWLVFALNTAIASAINGDNESAKTWIDQCLKEFPDDGRAKEILNAMP